MARIESLELTVRDRAIHCESCEERIVTLLKQLPGVLQVRADHRTQVVAVMLDTARTPVAEVREKLAVAGYEAA